MQNINQTRKNNLKLWIKVMQIKAMSLLQPMKYQQWIKQWCSMLAMVWVGAKHSFAAAGV